MGYSLTAMIKTHGSEKTPDQIDLVSFGIYDTEVLSFKDSKVNAGPLETIRAKYKGMMAKTPKGPKPLTFSWYPVSKDKGILTSSRGKTLDFRLVVINNENKDRWDWLFEEVKLTSPPRPLVRSFPGNFNRTDERYDALFIKFDDTK